jgi:hypothetical protein
MLFWALLASGQINMRKVDGWQTLAAKPIDQPVVSQFDCGGIANRASLPSRLTNRRMFYICSSIAGGAPEGSAMLACPKCRYCSAQWSPAAGVVAAKSFCAKCRKKRRQIAKRTLGLKPISSADLSGKFLLPRALRKSHLTRLTRKESF